MGYVLQMQELAARASINETQTIRHIIDGLRDRSANVAVLYAANTLPVLKQLVPRYVQLREASAVAPPVRVGSDAKPKATVGRTEAAASTSVPATIRCYNCSGTGHISANCPEPKRTIGSCFRCGSTGHILKDCPKPAPRNANRVALVANFRDEASGSPTPSDEDALSQQMGAANIVSVTFLPSDSVPQCNTCDSLFDTGSPISLMQRSMIPQQCVNSNLRESAAYSGYSGLGNFRLCTYGIIPIMITFRNITKKIVIYVVSDELLPCPLLLGRDFLSAFRIRLSMHYPANPTIVKPKVAINKDATGDRISVSDRVLHCVYESSGDQSYVCSVCRPSSRPVSEVSAKSGDSHEPFPHSDQCIPDIFLIASDALSSDIPFAYDMNAKSNSVPCGHIYPTDRHIFCIESEASSVDPSNGKYDIGPNLNVFHREAVLKIIHSDYLNKANIPQIPHEFEMRLRLNSDQPISIPPRRVSYADKRLIEQKVSDLLDRGIIRPSQSPYSFPIVMVPKGGISVCVLIIDS